MLAAAAQDKTIELSVIDENQGVREGMLDVTIFVPYRYDVIPASVTSYTRISE